MAFYLDTSAAVKLVVAEAETAALLRWLQTQHSHVIASDLVRTELRRATRRGAPEAMERADTVLESVTLLTMSTSVFERACWLDPPILRSLDALHLAAALELGDELEGIITYDDRLAEAARLHGHEVIAPK